MIIQKIKRAIKRFIVNTIIEDIQRNGPVRQMVLVDMPVKAHDLANWPKVKGN